MIHGTKIFEDGPIKHSNKSRCVKIYLKPKDYAHLQAQAQKEQFGSVGLYLRGVALAVADLQKLNAFKRYEKAKKELEASLLSQD